MPIPKNICIFEDEQASNLLPLTYTRPVFDLLCGTISLARRIQRFFPKANVYFKCRDYLAPLLHEQKRRVNIFDRGECLFINGRVLFDQGLYKRITSDSNATFMYNDLAVAFWNTLSPKKVSCDATLIQYPWDLISYNSKMIAADFKSGNQILAKTKDGGSLINRRKIFIGKNSRMKIGAVLDATDGPIIIGPNVTVMSNAVVEGPCFIGEQSLIKIGAKIYGGTSMGAMCKVGGEVEASIIQGYSNKQHDGFLGHSYIGEWCNLGADTNTSDLKNNYGPVKVLINGNEIDSGQIFVGLIMGDHSKSGINSMFNTGSVVGVSSNIFGPGFPPKTIPSFAWVNLPAIETYQLEKAVEVARIVMARRKVTLTAAYRQMLETIFEMTKGERSG